MYLNLHNCHQVENSKINNNNEIMSRVYLKKLGKNIRNARIDCGLSQEKLAELPGKTRNYVGMVERVEINVSAKSLFYFA